MLSGLSERPFAGMNRWCQGTHACGNVARRSTVIRSTVFRGSRRCTCKLIGSGLGKSASLLQFVESRAETGRAVLSASRCALASRVTKSWSVACPDAVASARPSGPRTSMSYAPGSEPLGSTKVNRTNRCGKSKAGSHQLRPIRAHHRILSKVSSDRRGRSRSARQHPGAKTNREHEDCGSRQTDRTCRRPHGCDRSTSSHLAHVDTTRRALHDVIPQRITQRPRAHGELAQRLARGAADAIRIRLDRAVNRVEEGVVRQLQHFLKPILLWRSGGRLAGFLPDQRAQFLNNEICW